MFVDWVNRKKKYLESNAITWVDSSNTDNPYYIYDDPSLNYIEKTFPTINCDICITP